jgi:hypothetical protein
MKSIAKYTADQARRFFRSNVQSLYSLYVWNSARTADLSNHNTLHVYIKGPLHQQQQKVTYSSIKIPVNVVLPYTYCLRFKGPLELF